MHLYSIKLSGKKTISLLNMSELFHACFSCSNFFTLSQKASRSDGRNFVFEIPEAMIAVDLSNSIKFFPITFSSFLPNIEFHFFSKLINGFSILLIRMVNIEIIICRCF